jgi:hypothetical protein
MAFAREFFEINVSDAPHLNVIEGQSSFQMNCPGLVIEVGFTEI